MRSGLPALALALLVAANAARADDDAPQAPAAAADPCPAADGAPCPSIDAQPEPGPATDAQPEPSSQPPQQVGWVDASHGGMERGINALVLRLDRFFGDSAHEPYQPPTSRIRLRTEFRSTEARPALVRARVSADVRLPAADRMLSRWSLVLTGESKPEPVPGPDPDAELVPPRFDARFSAAGGGLELRVDLFRASRTLVDAGVGARFAAPPVPFSRVRLAQGFPLGIRIVGHLTQTLFWDRRDEFGETTRLDVERPFGRSTLLRWWGTGTIDGRSPGYEWASEAGVQHALGKRTALYAAGAIEGATRSIVDVANYRLFTRLRRDVHRGWTFVEVEPELAWPADPVTAARSRVLGVTLRLEILFSTDGRVPTPLESMRDAPLPAIGASPPAPGGPDA